MPEPVSAQEMFELFQKMVNPMAFPMQSLLTAALNVKELDKKISELKTVEHWLQTNTAMLQMTIKTLEHQRNILQQTNSGVSGENPFASMAMWPWNAMQAAAQHSAASAAAEPTEQQRAKKRGSKQPKE